jgi:aldehyde dehydrogenase (NAD+)
MATAFSNMIDGRPVESTDRTSDINPSNIQDIVGEFARGTTADVEHAVAAAKQAFVKWSVSNPQERFDILDRAGTEILARKEELGKRSRARWASRSPTRSARRRAPEHLQVLRRRGGAYPRRQARSRCGPASKSTSPASRSECRRDHAVELSACDPGVEDRAGARVWQLRRLQAGRARPRHRRGRSSTFSPRRASSRRPQPRDGAGVEDRTGDPSSPDVDAVSFTGSQDIGIGIAVAAIKNGTRVQLEMGGKNPLIVLDDADLATAVSVAVNGAYFQAGQRCTASSRFIVTEGIHDRFIAGMVERMKTLVVDDALKPGPNRPVVDERSSERTWSTSRSARRKARRSPMAASAQRDRRRATTCSRRSSPRRRRAMRINREEIFGPVASVIA